MKKALVVLLIGAWMLSFRASSNKDSIKSTEPLSLIVKDQVDQKLSTRQLSIATSAYIYSYPLVLMELMRRDLRQTPMNQFAHGSQVTAAKSRQESFANPDLLTSTLWYDVRVHPLVIQTGESKGRYFELSFKDMWSEVFATPGSPLAMGGALRLVLVPEGYRGELPAGYKMITAPTPVGLITARVELKGTSDLENARAFQGTLTGMTLKEWQSKTIFAHKTPTTNFSQAELSPYDQLEQMNAEEYIQLFRHLLTINPPRSSDWNIIEQMKEIGIDSKRRFKFKELGTELQKTMTTAKQTALALIKNYQQGVIENGWEITREATGRFGSSYLARAAAAWHSNSSHLATSYIEAITKVDFSGQMLDGNSEYTLRFLSEQKPPVDSFWSLTIYNARGELIENRGGHYGLTSRENLLYEKDGSLIIYLQPHKTTNRYVNNWLATPRESFSVSLRLYSPGLAALTGDWMAPPIVKTPGDSLSE